MCSKTEQILRFRKLKRNDARKMLNFCKNGKRSTFVGREFCNKISPDEQGESREKGDYRSNASQLRQGSKNILRNERYPISLEEDYKGPAESKKVR